MSRRTATGRFGRQDDLRVLVLPFQLPLKEQLLLL